MLNINPTYEQKQVRFRRWSRKYYAVFTSISNHVTIGKVCASICNLSLKKSFSTADNQIISLANEKELEEEEEEIELYKSNPLKNGLFSAIEIVNQTLSFSHIYNITITLILLITPRLI